MKRSKKLLPIVLPCVGMLVLILDSKTALQGAQTGIELCFKSVIPSLFPFFVCSILLTGVMAGQNVPFLKPVVRFCKMPSGSENLLIVGLLGGYPVGAKCIFDSWKRGMISKEDAKRCLGFCSNAGPAFIFGMCSALFSNIMSVWVLWLIHITSALFVGNLLPGKENTTVTPPQKAGVSLPEAMEKSIGAMLSVCSWIVLFRVIIAFGQRWFLWLLPENWSITLEGLLELANGCISLSAVDAEGLRFVLSAGFLGLGGLCVGLQTVSVVGELGTGMYFPGKVLQCGISVCLAVLYASIQYGLCSPVVPVSFALAFTLLVIIKKTVDFPKRLVYNVEKNWKGDLLCYSERKSQNPAAIAPAAQK